MTDAASEPRPEPASQPDGSGSEWQRLDAKMLIIGPLQAARGLIVPLGAALIGLTASTGFTPWYLLGVVIPIALGVVPWVTTRYRLTESQFQLHKGLISRRRLTTPLDRIRSVDLEASVLHRVLGLTKVQIGTGVDDSQISLDSISVGQADELRAVLLARPAPAPAPEAADVPDEYVVPDAARELAALDPSWVRFAPFSLSKMAIVLAGLAAIFQFVNEAELLSESDLEDAGTWVLSFAIWTVVAVVAIGALVGWVALSMVAYLVQWWGFRLVRESGTLRMTAGALTTRSTTLEERRLRGAVLTEPVLVRMVGGAELATLATGGEESVARVLPPCPVGVAVRVGADALEDLEPLTLPLTGHGLVARRRCYVRALALAALVAVFPIAPIIAWELPWWPAYVVAPAALLIGGVTAEAAYRHLGHTLTRRHLVSGNGLWTRRRTALESDGVIGWVVRQSYFQRRQGLATLVATTAAGAEQVAVRDLALPDAIRLADRTTPGLLTAFLVSDIPSSDANAAIG